MPNDPSKRPKQREQGERGDFNILVIQPVVVATKTQFQHIAFPTQLAKAMAMAMAMAKAMAKPKAMAKAMSMAKGYELMAASSF